MGSGASANKGESQNEDLVVGESTRPKSSPGTTAEKRSDIPVTRLRRRPNSSTSKVVPINDSYADHSEVEQLKERQTSANRVVDDYEAQLTAQNKLVADPAVREHVECQHFNVLSHATDQMSSDGQCPGSVDHQVLMLQKELNKARAQIKKIKAQYKRRVREFNTKLAECKQERAMENFDHKNAIAKLTEEKATLSARVDELLKTQGDGSHVTSSQMIDARKTLILDLSSKVTEQETEIMRLREQLRAHAHNRAADTSETSTVGSEMPEYSWKSSEESSSRLRFDERDIRPTASGRDANGDRSSTLGRITLPPVDSCSKNSAEPRQTAGRYRAHWASSCFDVQDQVDGDDGNVLMAETQPASATQT